MKGFRHVLIGSGRGESSTAQVSSATIISSLLENPYGVSLTVLSAK